jgi:AcrR family transcriptional regulator
MPIQKVTREEILSKSLEVFRHRGYHNTSMNDLANAVGLLKGSFYHYFDSKETLMKEVLSSVNMILVNHVFPVAYDESLTVHERMETMLKRFSKAVFSIEGGCIVGNTILETVNQYPQFKQVLQEIIMKQLKSWQNRPLWNMKEQLCSRSYTEKVISIKIVISELWKD